MLFCSIFPLVFISACLDDCSSSNSYKTRCSGLIVEKCSYDSSASDSYSWQEYRDCSEDCPLEIGAIPSCSAGSCLCSVPSNSLCDRSGTYRCNGENAEQCKRLDKYDGAVWENLKNCADAFAADGVVERGACALKSGSEYYEPKCVPEIKKAFRGKWRRLDYAKDYYLGTNGITENYGSQVTPDKITKIDDNMLEITTENETFRLVRNSITDAFLKLRVKSAGTLTRLSSGGVGGIDVIIENTQDSGETYEKQSGSDGNTEFDGIVSGEYDISVGTTKVTQTVSDHLNAGNFYFAASGYVYKALMDDPSEIFYSEDRNDPEKGNSYSVTLRVYNLGNADASATTISLAASDETVRITAKEEILGTIEPEKSVSYRFEIETVPFSQTQDFKNEIYHDVPLLVSMKDISGETWEDVITIRIYRKSVPLYLHATMSNPFILLSPHREIVSMSNVVWVPYRPDAKYKLIAQSLSLNTEGVYSIGVGQWDDERWQSDRENFTDVSNFEPNDMESQAKTINMNSQTTSYLHKNDLDFWIIDMSK